MSSTGPAEELSGTLESLRDRVARLRLPLDVPGAESARVRRRRTAGQLDDYILPRLRESRAPLLAVVGGSTGVGKSTLVNSLAGRSISPAGARRPTTRTPVLVCHPQDAAAFADSRVLPGLRRQPPTPEPGEAGAPAATVVDVAAGDGGEPAPSLVLATSEAIPAGLALLDATDVDSVVSANRELAARLLAAGDLWVYVTSAARYADGLPFGVLREARRRGVAVAAVLDRVPTGQEETLAADFAALLRQGGLGDAPMFVLSEHELTDGRLPAEQVSAIRAWLADLAADESRRVTLVRRALEATLDDLRLRVASLADAAAEQDSAVSALAAVAERAFAAAQQTVDAALASGTLLRGEALARWQEFRTAGGLHRLTDSGLERLTGRLGAVAKAASGQHLAAALEGALVTTIRSAAEAAAAATREGWLARTEGAALLALPANAASPAGVRALPGFAPRPPATLADRAMATVADWRAKAASLVADQGGGAAPVGRLLPEATESVALLLTVVALAGARAGRGTPAGAASAATGAADKAEAAATATSVEPGRALLDMLLTPAVSARLIEAVRADLRARVGVLLADERARFTGVLAALDLPADDANVLHGALDVVQRARARAT